MKSAQKTAYKALTLDFFTHKNYVCCASKWGKGVGKRKPSMFRKTTQLTDISTLDQFWHNFLPNCVIYTNQSDPDSKNSLLSIESSFTVMTSLPVGQSRGTLRKVGFTVKKCYLHEAYLNKL